MIDRGSNVRRGLRGTAPSSDSSRRSGGSSVLHSGRQLVDRRRHVGEEPPDLGEGVLLVDGQVVDRAALVDVDVRSAELLLRHVGAGRRLDDGWAAGEDDRVALGHHVEVGQHGVEGRQAGGRTEHGRHDRDRVQQLEVDRGERVAVGQVRAADLLEPAHAAAGGIDQADVRQAPLLRPLGRAQLDAERAVVAAAGTAAHGEVTGRDDDVAPVDRAAALDLGVRQHRHEDAVVVVGGVAAEPTEAAERPGIAEAVEALQHRQLAERLLLGDALGTTEPRRQLVPETELVELVLPHHQDSRQRNDTSILP